MLVQVGVSYGQRIERIELIEEPLADRARRARSSVVLRLQLRWVESSGFSPASACRNTSFIRSVASGLVALPKPSRSAV